MANVTKAQRRTLLDAERFQRAGFVGVLAKGPRARSVAALEAAGLLRDAGMAAECDGDGFTRGDREWPAYEITAAGRAVLSAPSRAPEGGKEHDRG